MNHHRAVRSATPSGILTQLTVLSHTILLWLIMHLSKKANAKPANLSQSCWQVSYIQMNMGGEFTAASHRVTFYEPGLVQFFY